MGEPELEMTTRAYCKMIMHSAKFPSSNISGVLVSKKEQFKLGGKIVYSDCIPLFHMNFGLAPMIEVALAQVESQCREEGLVISGFYHAHNNLRDTHVDIFSQKVADKIAENQPGTLLVTIDSKRLSLKIESHALIVQQNIEGKWRSRERDSLRLENDITLHCASALVKKKIYSCLVDFDNHLDDVTQDYLNVELNMEIDSCL